MLRDSTLAELDEKRRERAKTKKVAVQASLHDDWPEDLAEAAYHGLAGDVVGTIEPHTESDPVALLLQFLAFFGSCIGRSAHYLVEGDKHFANLFMVIVGQSSKARKGTSWGRVRQLFDLLPEQFGQSRIESGLSSGEGLIHAVRDEKGDDPGECDKRLLLQEPEFGGLLRVMDRHGNIVSRIIRDAWDRGDLGVLTKKCETRATGAHISIVGHITKDELVRHLDRTEAANGFANRFIYVVVKRSKCLPHGGNLKIEHLKPLAARLATAVKDAKDIQQVFMSDETKLRWERVYPELSEGQPGLYGAVTGRAEAQVIRLALIYALLDRKNTISTEHLCAALAIWDYADESAKYIFGEATGDPVQDTILSSIKSEPEGLSRTDISQLFKGHQKSDRITRALDDLKRLGRIEKEKVKSEGRDAEVWKCT